AGTQDAIGRGPDAVQVDRILAAVHMGCNRARGPSGGGQRRRPVGEDGMWLDVPRLVVWFLWVAPRSGEGERRGDVEEAPARGVVETARADVGGRASHELEELRVVEIRPHGPDPGRGAGHDGRRE